jgi:hypothetical protein
VIAQVDKQNTAVIANAVHPAGQADSFADVGRRQIGAGVAAIGMHFEFPILRTFQIARVNDAGSSKSPAIP